MNDIQLKINYERAIELTDSLFNYLKNKFDFNIHMQYSTSYCSYFNISNFNQNYIVFPLSNCINLSIDISSYICDCEYSFILNLWKYDINSNHYFKYVPFNYNFISMDDFYKFCYDHIIDFFGLNDSYKQLSIFDFI